MAVERPQVAQQSAQEHLRMVVAGRGYPDGEVVLVDSFPYDKFTGRLTTNYIAAGYNFDDGGRAGEIGSTLTRRVYSLEFFVFGTDNTYASNLASLVESAFEPQSLVPILDIGGTGLPTGETMLVQSSSSQKMVIRDPRPYEYFVFLARAHMLDEYYAR